MTLRIRIPTAVMRTSTAGLRFIFHHEAWPGISEHLHWPRGSSGVTLGAGYDMKEKSRDEIVNDLRRVGLALKVADKAAAAAGLQDAAAEDFAHENRKLITLTVQQQYDLLREVIPPKEDIVKRHITVDLLQHEFDALVSFCYNPGGSFVPVAHAINTGMVQHAMRTIMSRAVTGHTQTKNAGLVRRRRDEVQLYLHGAYDQHRHRV